MSSNNRTLVKSRLVLFQDGTLKPATLVVDNGKIIEIREGQYQNSDESSFSAVIDGGDFVLMPGIVDSHVHVNEPGRTDWEGYETATRAAAAGGITSITDMPLNCIPSTISLSALETKLKEAKGKCYVDVAFWGGVVPGNQNELRPMIKAGVAGFKCFLIHSGVDEFPHVTEQDLHKAMKQLQGTQSVLLFHAEVETPDIPQKYDNPLNYDTFLKSRPDTMEVEAIRLVTNLCLQYNVRCHIVHLSSAQALPLIREAKKKGAPLTVETCHHYLTFNAEKIPKGSPEYKCCPPIRQKDNNELLWQAVTSGDIDMIVSDHSPCTANLKLVDNGDYMKAWGGISGLQFGLSLFWTSAQARGFQLKDIVHLMCESTAKLSSLDHRKGKLAVGYDADFVIWDPYDSYTIEKHMIQHKNKLTPYLGMKVQGVVHKTIVGGVLVNDEGKFSDKHGQFLMIGSNG